MVNHVVVKFGSTDEMSDYAIASEVSNHLNVNPDVSDNKVRIIVENGHVTMGGELQSNFQKEAVRKTVRNLLFIKSLTNDITLTPEFHK